MASRKTLFFGLGTFGLIVGVALLVIMMEQYGRVRRTDRESAQRKQFSELQEAISEDALKAVERLPLLYKEREQPFDSVARSTIREVSGSRKLYGVAPSLLFAEILFNKDADWSDTPLILVDHKSNKELLGVESIDSMATLKQVTESERFRDQLNAVRQKPRSEITKVDNELFVINNKAHDLSNHFAQLLYLVPPTSDQLRSETKDYSDWHLIEDAEAAGHDPLLAKSLKSNFNKLKASWTDRDNQGIVDSVEAIRRDMIAMSSVPLLSEDKINLELRFNSVKPFNYASWIFLVASFLGIFGLAFSKRFMSIACMVFAGLGALLMFWGGYARVVLNIKHVAITNLYESMVTVALGCVVAALIIDLIRHSRWNTMIGCFAGFVLLQIVDLNSVKYPDGIGGTIAVLSNNFWVHIHVPIVMLSYAFFFIAFLMSCVGLPWTLFSDPKAKDDSLRGMMRSAAISVNLGSLLIFVGLILGGVWAAESWGRFWGWDPKETWALILFLYYMVVVHGRFTSWLNPFWTNWMLFTGGNMLLWTYYGTNELLSGLHSYANSSGGDDFWENFVHERNRWFVVTTCTMAGISLLSMGYYLLVGRHRPSADSEQEVEGETQPEAI